MKGHWKLDVYEGEIQRKHLPLLHRIQNAVADLKWRLLGITSESYYYGEILNSKLDTIEGDNLIVTVGKQMILDRLFGLSSVGAMTRIGVGTSATAAAAGDTALTSGTFKVYDATPTRAGAVVTCITTFGTTDANINW